MLAEPDSVFVDVLSQDDDAVLALWRSISSPADESLLADPEAAALVAATHRESLRQGQKGWARDNVLRMPRWDVDLAAVKAPTSLWYGEQDAVANGRWLKGQIPHADLVVLADQGHFSALFQGWGRVVGWLSRT